uniref:Uncharacterized protein n=1 Tax=Cacopsylla melanoneura TaxID=428564 RepID=A0A8D8ZHT4_9HEMI
MYVYYSGIKNSTFDGTSSYKPSKLKGSFYRLILLKGSYVYFFSDDIIYENELILSLSEKKIFFIVKNTYSFLLTLNLPTLSVMCFSFCFLFCFRDTSRYGSIVVNL